MATELARSCPWRPSLADPQAHVSNLLAALTQQRSTMGVSQRYIVPDSELGCKLGWQAPSEHFRGVRGRQNMRGYLLSICCVAGTVQSARSREKGRCSPCLQVAHRPVRTRGGNKTMTQCPCQIGGMGGLLGAQRRSPNQTEGLGTAF